MRQWIVYGRNLAKESINVHIGLALRGTMKIESKRLSHTTQDYRETSTGFPSGIFKQTTGSTNTTNTLIPHPPSLIMMGFLTLTSLVAVIMVQLCLVYITLIAYSPIVITVLLVGIVINVILSLKMAHILMGSLDWLRVVTKAQKKRGLDKQIEIGGKVV